MRWTLAVRLGMVVGLAALVAGPAQAKAQWAQQISAEQIPAAQQMQPVELNRLLHRRGAAHPLILQVGSRVLFDEAHITGAEYVGPASEDAGLQLLRNRVAKLPRTTFIVLYCGCCPWDHCPNVGPAFQLLSRLGFSRVKVLYLAHNFGADWVEQGYATARDR